jgi:hypothetical protein
MFILFNFVIIFHGWQFQLYSFDWVDPVILSGSLLIYERKFLLSG